MGAPTTNRKRTRHLDSASQLHLHVSKKPKPSPSLFVRVFNALMPSQTTLSRVRLYPKPQSLKREVHAPRRSFNFPNPTLSCFYPRFQHRKTPNFDRKEKVIVVVDDSSVEEAEIVSSSSAVSDRSKKSAEAGRTLGFFPNNRTAKRFREPPHRNLCEPTRKRPPKLSFLAQIEWLIKKWPFFGLSTKKSDKDLVKEAFVELTNNEEEQVSQAFSTSNRCKVLVTHSDSNIEITGKVLQCLRPGAWLNDEVINLYLELLKEREKREPEKFLKCHFFNTFFYKKLISGKGGYDFKAVRRWTTQRKIGYSLIECDKIFVPIHKDTHWCLAVINRKDEKFQYLDSLKGMDLTVLEVLARYYVDEVKDKSAKDIDVNTWKEEYVSDLPEQKNGFDCGVFMIKYADFYSRGLGLCFDQKHMLYFRKRTAKEILRLKAE